MDYDIRLGSYRLVTLESMVVKKSVENLAATCTITLPGAVHGRALEIEGKVAEGDRVVVKFGYDGDLAPLPTEFEGWIESITTNDDSLVINCEDEIYKFRRDIPDKVLKNITVKALLEHVIAALGGGYTLDCDYDFKYDNFTIRNATGFDVLKKVQEETKANIYLTGTTLHIHPQYSKLGRRVVYDLERNVEKSSLTYKDARKRKMLVTVEGTDAKGKVVRVEKGATGGDKFTIKLPGVSDPKALAARAEQEVKLRAYSGYDGDITGWLIPQVEPTDRLEIRDRDYEYKNGVYYVVAVETTFSEAGGSRKCTLGKKLE